MIRVNENVRTLTGNLMFGLIGAEVCTVFQYVRITLISTYPPLNLVIGLSISSISGFLCYGLGCVLNDCLDALIAGEQQFFNEVYLNPSSLQENWKPVIRTRRIFSERKPNIRKGR